MLIREDVLFVKNAVNKLIDLKQQRTGNPKPTDEVVESSLWYSAIAQYGRCFNKNEGGYTRLEVNDIFALPTDQLLKDIHDNLMILRNRFVAHRDDTEYEQAVIIMQIPKAGGDDDKIAFNIKAAITFSPPIDSLKDYIKLFDFLLPKIDAKIQKQTEKTKDGLLKNFDASEINCLLIR
jgi:hypothetical protein